MHPEDSGHKTGPSTACACGGIDAPENMQWQSVAEAKAKDKWERNDCELPATIPPVALPSEPSMRSRVDVRPWRGERRGDQSMFASLDFITPTRGQHHAANRGIPFKWRLPQTGSWMPDQKIKARFIEPMLLLRTEKLPEGPDWLHELEFDGYRALAKWRQNSSPFPQRQRLLPPISRHSEGPCLDAR
jgi:hypothetical protein